VETRITLVMPKSVADTLCNLVEKELQLIEIHEVEGPDSEYEANNLKIVYGLLKVEGITGEAE
jgi:hypothetical protein